jgi:hypothetical protein
VKAVEVILDDEADPLWALYRIEIVPTVILFEHGEVTRRLDGRPGIGLSPRELEAALAAG